MSNLIARKHIFRSGELIRASEWNEELEQLYQLFSGQLSSKIILQQVFQQETLDLINTNTNTLILKLQSLGLTKVQARSDTLRIESLVTDVAPFAVVSTTKVANLNAKFLDDLPLSSFFTSGKIVETFPNFYFDGVAVVADEVYRWITPAGTSMSIRQFAVSSSVRTTYPSNDAVCTVDLKKNGVAVDTATLQQSIFSYSNSTLNIGLVENDVISCHITSNNGIEKCRNISAKFKFRQTLV